MVPGAWIGEGIEQMNHREFFFKPMNLFCMILQWCCGITNIYILSSSLVPGTEIGGYKDNKNSPKNT